MHIINKPTPEELQILSTHLEQQYALPEGTFMTSDEGCLVTYFHTSFRETGSDDIYHIQYFYTLDPISNSFHVVIDELGAKENMILALLYFEHLTLKMNAKDVTYQFNHSSYYLMDDRFFHHLGLPNQINQQYKKNFDLESLDVLMTAKRDVYQSLIDLYLTDHTVSYSVKWFNHEMTIWVYCLGERYWLDFSFQNGQFSIACPQLEYDDVSIEGSLYPFMTKLLREIVVKNRLTHLLSPYNYHFLMLCSYEKMDTTTSDLIYNHLLQRYGANHIEIECAHKNPNDVFTTNESIISMTLFENTYHYDSSTKKVSFGDIELN